MPYKDPQKKRENDRLYYLKNRDAIREKQRLYNELHAESNRERARRWERDNRPKVRERARRRRQEKAQEIKEYYAMWREKNRQKIRQDAHRRRLQRRGVPLTEEAVDYVSLISGDPCAYCGGAADSVDHITPVSYGGNSDWDNLAPACKSCNSAKKDKSLLQFLLDGRAA